MHQPIFNATLNPVTIIGLFTSILCLLACQNDNFPNLEQLIPKLELCHSAEQSVFYDKVKELEQKYAIEIAVSAVHTQLGCSLHYKSEVQFPMASVLKIPIAVHLFREIDKGAYTSDQKLKLTPKDLRHHSYITYMMRGKNSLEISLKELVKLMLQESDNTASDAVIKLLGGPKVITEALRKMGYNQLHIDRYYIQMLADLYQVKWTDNPEEWSYELIDRLIRRSTVQQQREGFEKFQKDTKDCGSTRQISQLLTDLVKGNLLSHKNTKLLLAILEKCRTSENRLVAGVPKGTKVAHKTGTLPGVVNDAGIIYLGEDLANVAVTIFIKGSDRAKVERDEQVIATLSTQLCFYFKKTVKQPYFFFEESPKSTK